MVAIRLLAGLVLKLGAGVLVFYACVGLSLPLALLCAPLFLIAFDAVMICGTFAISWPWSAERPNAARPFAFAKMIAAECLVYSALFSVIQPFETLFDGKSSPASQGTPVLLVPGYLCNSGLWWWLRKRLHRAGIYAEPVNLEPPLASIGDLAETLHAAIEALLKETGSEKLALVTHSMGGLIARSYLAQRGSARISKLIILACPHHGTRLAYAGFGDNAREMEPGSEWLFQLNKSDPGSLPITNIWSVNDNFVVPQESGRVEGVKELVLPSLGHLSFAFSQRVLALLIRELSA